MTIVVDLIILGIIALCVIIGYVRGLTGSLIGILSFVLSLVVAFVLFMPVSSFIVNGTNLDEDLEKSIREIIIKDDTNEESEEMPSAITDYINQKVEEAANQAKENIVNSTARDVSVTIIKAGTWIVLFIVSRILMIFLKFITSLIAKLPVIKQCDKLGGIIYGLVKGLIITYVALAIISFVTPLTEGTISESIKESRLGSQMYNNNLLLKIIF